jgi:hypothetical protein
MARRHAQTQAARNLTQVRFVKPVFYQRLSAFICG